MAHHQKDNLSLSPRATISSRTERLVIHPLNHTYAMTCANAVAAIALHTEYNYEKSETVFISV